MSGLLEGVDGDELVDVEVADRALVRAMLDVESALARALERAGLVDPGTGAAVTSAVADLDVDPADLGRRAVASGNPVVPLVRDVLDAVPEAARGVVHLGATSQDVLDTALMLCASRALDPLLHNLSRARAAGVHLADEHRGTLMVARTLGQPALPTTFGAKVAGWVGGLDAARARLEELRPQLAVQLGGAAGTLSAYGDRGLDVAGLLADELGLADPGVPWHTERSRVQQLAAGLGAVIAAAGKVATDVLLMSQAEVGEVAEPAPGGSSAMPHKRNPVASVLVVAAARRSPALVGSVFASGLHENERATGSWHAEWVPLRDLLRLAGGASARVADVLDGLRVDVSAMRRNLDAAGPGVLSEAVAGVLIPALGRSGAQEVARRAVGEAQSSGVPLDQVVAAAPIVAELLAAGRLDRAKLQAATDPAGCLGSATAIVDRVLGANRR